MITGEFSTQCLVAVGRLLATLQEMNEILHANIFFVIASVATICFCILTCIILFQVIKILKTVRVILARIEEGSEVIAEDLYEFRETIKESGVISGLIGLFFGGRATVRRKKRPVTKHNDRTHGKQKNDEEEFSN